MEPLPGPLHSNVFHLYISTQLKQVEELRNGRILTNGKLVHFRASLEIRDCLCPIWLSNADKAYACPMYGNIRDVRALERKLRHGDFIDFITQCCAIVEMLRSKQETGLLYLNEQGEGARGQTWLFDFARNLGDVATLRHRLMFRRPSRIFELLRDSDMFYAVQRVVQRSRTTPTWQEIVMIFQAADLYQMCLTLIALAPAIEERAKTFPKPASSLLLSLIAEAVLEGVGNFAVKMCQQVILKLVECGASLMVSLTDHGGLFEAIERHMRLNDTPWWLKQERSIIRRECPEATTVNRLLCNEWPNDFLQQLRHYCCCSLDTAGVNKVVFGVKLASLQCLAAQNLPKSQLAELSCFDKSIAAKHIGCEL